MYIMRYHVHYSHFGAYVTLYYGEYRYSQRVAKSLEKRRRQYRAKNGISSSSDDVIESYIEDYFSNDQ
jgi:hypothetical protein